MPQFSISGVVRAGWGKMGEFCASVCSGVECWDRWGGQLAGGGGGEGSSSVTWFPTFPCSTHGGCASLSNSSSESPMLHEEVGDREMCRLSFAGPPLAQAHVHHLICLLVPMYAHVQWNM